jgi:hypothetical protein
MKLAGLQQYLITYWESGKKYCYRMGTNNIEDYRNTLKGQYNRFTIEEV